MRDYAVVIEKGDTSYGAYIPDLPGCVAVGETLEEVEALIKEAIELHLEMMQEEGLLFPNHSSDESVARRLAYCLAMSSGYVGNPPFPDPPPRPSHLDSS